MSGLLSRQRVELALSHRATDRVPTDFWAVPEVSRRLENHLGVASHEALLELLGVDMRLAEPDYVGPVRPGLPDGSYFDQLGRHLKRASNTYDTYEEYAGAPLGYAQSVDDLRGYDKWPLASWWNWQGFSEKIGRLHEDFYIKFQTGGLFETAWALRGYETFFVDMAIKPEIPHFIMGKLCDFFCGYLRAALESAGEKLDMVLTYDDVASQSSLLMSAPMWREFIMPYHQQVNAIARNHGKKIMYHSCGAVRPLIQNLMELPIDVLNPLQPLAKGIDLAEIKQSFGRQLCFHGAIDIQELLPRGSPGQIRTKVGQVVDVLGRDGGYILAPAHYIQADTPMDNILALYDISRGKNVG